MEAVGTFFTQHQEALAGWAEIAGHLVVGCVLSGLTLGCIYLMYFLAGVLKLPVGSREYYQLREHIMSESLLRYGITIVCIFTIDALIVVFFDWGAKAMLTGTSICLLGIFAWEVGKRIRGSKAKDV